MLVGAVRIKWNAFSADLAGESIDMIQETR